MDKMIDTVTPNFIEHEGMYYLEYQGEFFKGCRRCQGSGHYMHNGEHDRCYSCDNSSAKLGEQIQSREEAEKWCHGRAMAKARRERKKEEARLAKLAARQQVWDSLKASNPAVWDLLWEAYEGTTERSSFVLKMASTLYEADRFPYTEKQISALQAVVDRRAEEASKAVPAPSGRVEVVGTVMSTRVVEGDYGISWKILVLTDAGYKVWGTLPRAQADILADEFCDWMEKKGYSYYSYGGSVFFTGSENGDLDWKGAKGRRIKFTATLSPSADDPSFAFYSRPTKGEWL